MTNISATATALIKARREGFILDDLPGGLPSNLDEAYVIQNKIIEGMSDIVVGWKVAFTNKLGQQKMGVDGPGSGPIFASYTHESPAQIFMPDPSLRISECEFAFKLTTGLPIKETAYSDDDIRPLIGSVHPAIEIVDRRLSHAIPMTGIAVIVDHGGNGGFVHGDGDKDWEKINYENHLVRQIINGEEKAQGSSKNVMEGNPIGSKTWLANHLKERGLTLKAGDWVSTGSAAEILPVPVGGTVIGDFGALGTVEASFG